MLPCCISAVSCSISWPGYSCKHMRREQPVCLCWRAFAFAALSPFIWCGHRWAMFGALAMSVAATIMVATESPAEWWLGLPLVVVFGVLTAVAVATGSGTVGSNRAKGNAMSRIYAIGTYAYTLPVVFLWPLSI